MSEQSKRRERELEDLKRLYKDDWGVLTPINEDLVDEIVIDQKSFLPRSEEVLEEIKANMMRVEVISLYMDDSELVLSAFKLDVDGIEEDCYVKILEIDDKRVRGYIPSKVWYDKDGYINVLYYVSGGLPEAVRPFKGKTYLMWRYMELDKTLVYDGNIRMFMDQIMGYDGRMMYVWVFDEGSINDIL
jgi:hypothetical protein